MDLTTIGTVVALFASAFGVFVAVDQLTAASRQKKFAEFLAGAVDGEESGSAQQDVLVSLRRETVARLVGASAVPSWTMAGDAATLGMIASVMYSMAPMLIDRPTPTDPGGWWAVLWPFLFVFAATWLFSGSLIVRIDERRRIADDYLAGKMPLTPRQEFGGPLTGGTPAFIAVFVALGVIGVSCGVATVVAKSPNWGLSGIVFGCIILGNAATTLRRYLARRRGYLWMHPEPAKPGSTKPQPTKPEPTRVAPTRRKK